MNIFKQLWNKLFPPAELPTKETIQYKYAGPPERKKIGSNYTPPKKKRR